MHNKGLFFYVISIRYILKIIFQSTQTLVGPLMARGLSISLSLSGINTSSYTIIRLFYIFGGDLKVKYIGYIGTYTKGASKGIYRFTLDTDKKTLSKPQLAAELDNPTYVVLNKDRTILYSVAKQNTSGGVATFTINHDSGELTLKDIQVTEGPSPCHISVDDRDKLVVTAHYHRGTIEAYAVSDQQLHPAHSIVQHKGSGVNKDRQEKPHVHFAGFAPEDKYVVTVDLGTDEITTYQLLNQQLTEKNRLTVRPGSGPRLITIHPNGIYDYLMTEISNEVIALYYDASNGSFEEIQYIRTIPNDFTENSQGSAIHITSDGQYIYVGNRGHNSIAVFSVDATKGTLTFIEHVSTKGDWPRDFRLDPTESFLIASNQESHNLILFERNTKSGKLTLLPSEVSVPYPVCVTFMG